MGRCCGGPYGLRLTSPDDHVALERGALIYDALYAQLKRSSFVEQ